MDALLCDPVTAHLLPSQIHRSLSLLFSCHTLNVSQKERPISCLLAIITQPNEWAETLRLKKRQGFPPVTQKEYKVVNISNPNRSVIL